VDSCLRNCGTSVQDGTEIPAGGLVLVETVLSGGTVEVPTDDDDAVVFGGWTLAWLVRCVLG
jgi:hypothetical protein